MTFRILIALFLATMSILVVFTVNRRVNVGSTITCIILPFLFAGSAWDNWTRWHAASGSAAVQYALAFVLTSVACAAMLTALGRRLMYLRHHTRDSSASG